MCGKMNSRPTLMITSAMIRLIYASMLTWNSRYMITDNNTATEIQVSFMVSAPEAINTFDLTDFPVLFKYIASRYFMMTLETSMIIVAIEKSTGSGVMIFSIDSIMISMPAIMIIVAIIMVVIRSILAR